MCSGSDATQREARTAACRGRGSGPNVQEINPVSSPQMSKSAGGVSPNPQTPRERTFSVVCSRLISQAHLLLFEVKDFVAEEPDKGHGRPLTDGNRCKWPKDSDTLEVSMRETLMPYPRRPGRSDDTCATPWYLLAPLRPKRPDGRSAPASSQQLCVRAVARQKGGHGHEGRRPFGWHLPTLFLQPRRHVAGRQCC